MDDDVAKASHTQGGDALQLKPEKKKLDNIIKSDFSNNTGPTEKSEDNFQPLAVSETQVSNSQLMLVLKQRTEALASEEPSLADFSNCPVATVNLAIIRKPQRIDDKLRAAKYSHCKEELENVYIRSKSNIACEKMFDNAKATAQLEADRKFKKDEVKAAQGYVEKHGNIVGVVGQAGIGKTTSAKKWAKQILKKELVEKTSFFFYIVIRRIDFREERTLLQFLLSAMSIQRDYTPEQEREILKIICSDPNVVMIFDGLDEAAFESFMAEVPQPQPNSKYKAEIYLKHLAGGNLLPRARKVFTSRPSLLYKLHPSYRPKFIIQILGLTQKSQDELGRQICEDRYNDIEKKMEQNRTVFAYCYVPVNFILTLNYLMGLKEDIEHVSLTRVLAFTWHQYLTTDHLRDREAEVDKLAKLAWDAFLEMKMLLDVIAFEKAGIDESTADAFTNMVVTTHGKLNLRILDGDKVRHFSHPVWQEFFAAFYMMMIMDIWEFKKKLDQLLSSEWDLVSMFVFGFCDSTIFRQLGPLVPESSHELWMKKISMLMDFLNSKPELTKEKIKRICSWAHEANDEKIACSVASLLSDDLDLCQSDDDISLLPHDFENLSFVVQHRATPLTRLDLSRNKIGNTGPTSLGRCLKNMERLIVKECEIEGEGVEELCKEVKQLHSPLKRLDLTHNEIGIEGILSLCADDCLQNIKELVIRECWIETEGIEKLCDGVKRLKEPLKRLDLCNNMIGDNGAKSLGPCLHNVEELLLKRCWIKSEGVKKLCEGVKELKSLDLSENQVGNAGAAALGRYLPDIKSLLLKGCEIKSEAFETLCSHVNQLDKPMELLCLADNGLSDKCAESLKKCVSKINVLDVRSNFFTRKAESLIKSKSSGKVVFN